MVLWIVAACSSSEGGRVPLEPTTTEVSPAVDPFAPQPDTSEGLVNVSDDLDALLEHGELVGACDRWRASPGDRRLELLCGKSMFFYEGFGTLGIPAPLFDFLPEGFPEEVGPAYEELGLVPHPVDVHGRPIGFGYGAPQGNVETLALTCAACHFGPLPDGRYAVGAPNHGYDYGRHMLALLVVPQAASPTFDEADHHPDAIAAVRPMLDRFDEEPLLALQLGIALLPLLAYAVDAPAPTWEQEGQYASWAPGTMDFVIAPLPVDDGVHTVSKTLALWGLPTDEEIEAAGLPHAMLAWSGGAESLTDFLAGFVQIGGGDEEGWDRDALAPLGEYILSLRAPAPLDPPDPILVEVGEVVFADAGCLACHGAPRGGGDRIYTFEEIGTDPALARWGDPDGDGVPCCGLGEADTTLTGGLKSPRLTGLFAASRFLHNGGVGSLEELLCLGAGRPPSAEPPLANTGHAYGCDLPDADREALVAYLLAH